jgi:hypothetical protein
MTLIRCCTGVVQTEPGGVLRRSIAGEEHAKVRGAPRQLPGCCTSPVSDRSLKVAGHSLHGTYPRSNPYFHFVSASRLSHAILADFIESTAYY